MKNNLIIFLCILFTSFFFVACKTNISADEQTAHIPNDANTVVTLHIDNLIKKLNDGNVQIESLFNKNNDASIAKQIAQAQKAINTDKPLYYFTKTKNTIAGGLQSFSAVVASLKKESAVTEYLSQFEPNATIKKTEKFSFVNAKNSLIGWDENTLIFIFNNPDEQLLLTLFTQNKELSLATNQTFNASVNNTADANFFVNIASLALANPTLAVSNLSLLLKDTYTTGNIHFNNGSVDGDLQTVYGSELQQIIQNNAAAGTSVNILEKYPEQPGAVAAISVNPNLLKTLVEKSGIKSVAEQYLSMMNMSIDEIINNFTGNINIASSNLMINNNSLLSDKINFSSLFAGNYITTIDINNKAIADNLFRSLSFGGMLSANNGFYSLSSFGGQKKGFIKIDDNKIIYGSTQDFINKFYNNHAPISLPEEANANLNGKVFSLYLDVQTVYQQLLQRFPTNNYFTSAKNTFRNFYLYQNKFTDGKSSGLLKLNLINNDQNSLPLIASFISQTPTIDVSQMENNSITQQQNSGIPEEDLIADTTAFQNLNRP